MNAQMQLMKKVSSESSFTPVQAGKIQRKQSWQDEKKEACPKCRKGLLNLQRSSTNTTAPSSVPPIVNEVLNSSGEPLDAGTRAFMEPRFGHDFSNVRVHTDKKAAESARDVNALAYTVGKDIVMGAGRYIPATKEGKYLIAYELAHFVQQTGSNERRIGQNKEQLYRPNSLQLVHIAERRRISARIQRQLYPPIPIIITPGSAVEINAVDARQETRLPWYVPWRYTGPITNFFRGDVTMTDTVSMVTNVLAFLRGRKIHRLNIMDHGNKDGVEIGHDWMETPADVATHAGDLGRLTSSFGSGAFVHMQNCHSGKNQPLICALARAFGTPVYAGTGPHNPLLGFNFGDYVRCEPSGAFTPDAGRPQTPTPPPSTKWMA